MMNPFYFDTFGERRKNAIYAPVIDRFLLVDNVDINITFDTANILSSKIATMVYATPHDTHGMTNENCLEYMLFDKSGSSKNGTPSLIKGQIPTTKRIDNPLQFTFVGPLEDPQDPELPEMMTKLKEYTDFVHKEMTLIHCIKLFGSEFDTRTFAEEYFQTAIIDGKKMVYDNSKYELGILIELKRVLYTSNSIEEATDRIDSVWKESNSVRMNAIRDHYREALGR